MARATLFAILTLLGVAVCGDRGLAEGAPEAPAANGAAAGTRALTVATPATRPSLATTMDLRFRAATPSSTPRPALGGPPRLSLRSVPSLDAFPQTPDVLTATPSLSLFRTNWAAAPAGARRVELSRADCALKGFGRGASLGLWLGALAMTTNMWDERTSWYVGGAAAAAGALLGGTLGVESDAWRTRYDWE